jgi:hypothetical protein
MAREVESALERRLRNTDKRVPTISPGRLQRAKGNHQKPKIALPRQIEPTRDSSDIIRTKIGI